MDKLERAKRDLVIANRILAMHHVVDAYGHVSLRHPLQPDRFLLSRSLSPELVTLDDIIAYRLDGTSDDDRPPYLERFIHGALYETRPELNVVVHAHAEATLPFGISKVPMQPVINQAADMGKEVPVWDIATRFGRHTNTMVTDMDQGRDLADCLGGRSVVLMRGHGFTAAGTSLVKVVNLCVVIPRNARVQLEAMRMGPMTPLWPGEIDAFDKLDADSPATRRGWNYWAVKAGCGDLL